MNEHTVKGKWREIKGDIQRMWGDLNADDLERTEGDMTSITGIIQQKYGHAKDEISRKLSEIVAKYDNESINNNDNYQRDLRKDKDLGVVPKI